MRFLIIQCLCTLSLTALLGCAPTTPSEPASYKPSLIPSGWVADFSYTGSLGSYLQTQASTAKSRSLNPIIYVFDDSGRRCRTFRRRMNYEGMSELFDDKYVIMLSHEYIHQLVGSYDEIRSSPLDQIGILVRIDDSGNIIGPVIDNLFFYSNNRANQRYHLKQLFKGMYGSE
jgi:hypothetical protein